MDIRTPDFSGDHCISGSCFFWAVVGLLAGEQAELVSSAWILPVIWLEKGDNSVGST